MKELAIHGGIPVFGNKSVQHNKYGSELSEALLRVSKQGYLSEFRGGKEVKAFESEFASYIGSKFAIATTSGTTALHSALSALQLPLGSEVAVPALTFVSTASVVLQEKLTPLFVDVDESYCMDPIDLERKISVKTKAIIPVHLYGHPANMDKLKQVAKENALFIIEDACQSHGAEYNTIKTGNLGDIGCFSFFETKNMSCGEGGMITTSDRNLYDRILLIKEHGSPRNSDTWYNYVNIGYNYNMTELQAAVGRSQLHCLDDNNTIRKENARLYRKYLEPLGLHIAKTSDRVKHVHHNQPILLREEYRKHRNFFVAALKAEGASVDIAYPKPLYKTKLFIDLGYNCILPITEDVTSRLFTVFTDPSINEETIIMISHAIEKVLDYTKVYKL